MGMVVERFNIFLVNLDPTIGYEIQKTRPCVVISPNEMNRKIETVIIAPMTTKSRNYPTRVACYFQGKDGQIVLDQIRAIDKSQLVRRIGEISFEEREAVLNVLAEMFGE